MSRYLDRLKSENRLLDELPKLPKPQKALGSFDSGPDRCFQKNAAADLGDLYALIGQALAEIERAGHPWTGWRRSLTDEQRRSLQALEAKIDEATLAGNWQQLESVLEAYRKSTLSKPGSTEWPRP